MDFLVRQLISLQDAEQPRCKRILQAVQQVNCPEISSKVGTMDEDKKVPKVAYSETCMIEEKQILVPE